MPELPPVTTAIFPSSFPISSTPLVGIALIGHKPFTKYGQLLSFGALVDGAVLTSVKQGGIASLEALHRELTMEVITPI
jgi:hypothetical protein